MEMNDQIGKKQKLKIVFVVILSVLLAAAGAFALYWHATADDRLYRQGMELMAASDYNAAIEVFEALPDHEQAAQQMLEAKYQIAQGFLGNKQYPEAAEVLCLLDTYKDSAQQAQLCYYHLGTSARLKKEYESARNYYSLAGEYSDAATQVQRMIYTMGHEAFLAGDYAAANDLFDQLEGSQTDYGNPHFETLADAAEYLDDQRLNLSSLINFHVDEDSDEEFYETLRNIFPCQYYYANYYKPNKLLTIAGIHYYPGENILNALRNDDTSRLTEEEHSVLELAQQVVAQALSETNSPYETELWLHDWLCNQVTYESPNMEIKRKDYIQLRELTCVGAMLDGIANCQGYADAFYLLGNMAGLEVERVLGEAGEGHIWNTILLDGKRYIVDVTFDDFSDQDFNGWSYTYFNTFWDRRVYDPYGNDEAGLPITAEKDLSQGYFYHSNRVFTNLNDAADGMVSQYVDGGSQWTYAMVEDDIIMDHNRLDRAVTDKLLERSQSNRSISWLQWLDFYGGSTYIVIYWQ